MAEPLIEARGLGVRLGQKRHFLVKDEKGFPVLSDISFSMTKGEIVALVGESGSGKTTLGRAIAGLTMIQKGRLLFEGVPIVEEGEGATIATPERHWYGKWRRHRKDIQMIFQDPLSSLNPRRTIGQSLAVPIRNFGTQTNASMDESLGALLAQVGLPAEFKDRYPHRLSGGQRQRVGIARALAGLPKLIVADEVVSGLDVSSQARILSLLKDLRQRFDLSVLFITHDLAVVRALADRVLVMQRGKIREDGPVDQVFGQPKHTYTRKLLAAVPSLQYEPDWLATSSEGSLAMKIENAVVLITGANRGIGRRFVDAALTRGAAKVYAAARTIEDLPKDPRIVPLALDITDASAIADAAKAAPDVTLLIN
ncbi:MAG: ATP-binding cassette domain-containing protein, partial [Pseudomonadota bacterium]